VEARQYRTDFFYDANRGEAYRDFADPIAMTARSLVEGLFGIRPNALQKELLIVPGFPTAWDHASIRTPDLQISFRRESHRDLYSIEPNLLSGMRLKMRLPARLSGIQTITVNGKNISWKNLDASVGLPMIEFEVESQEKYQIEIFWSGAAIEHSNTQQLLTGEAFQLQIPNIKIVKIQDASEVLENYQLQSNGLHANLKPIPGKHLIFSSTTK